MSEKLFHCFWFACYTSFLNRFGAVKNMQTSNFPFCTPLNNWGFQDPDTIVADPHQFDADADPACHFDAVPDPADHVDADPDPDPSFHFDVYRYVPDPDPSFTYRLKTLTKGSNRLIFHTFWLVISKLMQIRIQLITFAWIRIHNTAGCISFIIGWAVIPDQNVGPWPCTYCKVRHKAR